MDILFRDARYYRYYEGRSQANSGLWPYALLVN